MSEFHERKAAMSGMAFLLQQMRSTPTETVAIKEPEMSFKEPEPQKCKQPIRPETVQYKLLEETVPGYVQLEPLQIISDCYNEGSTPKFNFSTDCAENNYVRSCKFSPTGTHLITDSEDRRIRIFDFDEEKATLKKSILNGDLIYDLIWDPFGENFVTTSGGSPIKLWDCDGNQIASYHGINHFDELDFAYCMAFDLNGQKLYAGYCGIIRRFDVEKPGAQISEFKTYVKKQGGQRSILSCIDMSPAMQGVFCVGSFNSCVGLYSDYTNSCDLLIPTKNRFITCVKYGSNGTQIYVGGRKSSLIECYDIRNTSKLLSQYIRPVSTGQRIHFKLDPEDRYLFSGSSMGDIRIFDLKSIQSDIIEPAWIVENASKSVTSSIDLHPSKPIVATTHGQRVFPIPLNNGYENEDIEKTDDYLFSNNSFDNSLKFWKF